MAVTPSLLRLALLLLGAVGRAGPRPQVSPGDRATNGRGTLRCSAGAGASGGAPGLDRKLQDPRRGKAQGSGQKETEELRSSGEDCTSGDYLILKSHPTSRLQPLCQGTSCPAVALR